jgi:hypothetical protein
MAINRVNTTNTTFTPTEVLYDPTNKLRTSNPQALIDTDFEYGVQNSKWESVGLISNRPFSYQYPTAITNITSITQSTNSRTVTVNLTVSATATPNGIASATPATGFFTVTTTAAHGFQAGQYVSIAGVLTTTTYNGTWLIYAVPTSTTFVVQSTITGTATFSSPTAIAGVAPVNFTPIVMQDTYLAIANGNFIIESGGGTASFTYTARAANTTALTSIFDANKTNLFAGQLFQGASIGATGSATFTPSGNKVTVVTSVPHGLSIGNEIAVTGASNTGQTINGSFLVAQITNPTTFAYYVVGTAPSGISATSANVYVRPQAQFLHRPFDGGVIFSTNAGSNYEQAIRQTRRYFRYQSGKGIQVSSGTILKPNLQIDSLTCSASGGIVTVQTKEKHNIQPGATITVFGANETAYNGTFTVTSVTGYNTFTYVTAGAATPSALTASGTFYVAISGWYGASNRLGLFDTQNGVFWEFDGQTLNVVRRNSTYQIAGKVSVTNGSGTVTQTSTSFPTGFSKQLAVNDFIVIRGQSYRVVDIASDTSLTISPTYRGATAANVIVSKTIETRIPQSQFNIDKIDGTGPSGYNVDLTKMQMFYIDYTWYGAGFIRWGIRGPNGDVIYVHKLANNNVNTEAYMRSGNLPARYESVTIPPYTQITSAGLPLNDTTIPVASTSGFPTSGALLIRRATEGNEYVTYTGITSTSFTGVTRAQGGSTSLSLTVAAGSNVATAASTSGLAIGQRVIDVTNAYVPEGTFISAISGTTVTLSQAVTGANPTVVVPPMGNSASTAWVYSSTNPISVELAYPSFAPTISHWGTSVIMDGRFDDDKSLLFTYGQTAFTTIASGAVAPLLTIRVAPSVDNGKPGPFGSRELINRMQLVLRALDITTKTSGANLLITAVLNGIPSTATTYTNAVRDSLASNNSSLAQIADYAGGTTRLYGGEVTGGFFVGTTGSIDLSLVRDLGNSILGGGGATADIQGYPDGPDTLTIVCTNVGSASADVIARVSWSEAQA